MSAEQYIKLTSIKGLFLIERPSFTDNRGFFREVFHLDELLAVTGVEFNPVQLNHSLSKPRVVRGMHAENWNKLVYPVTGKMFAAIADVRPESETFGKVETFIFDGNPLKALFVAKGLANSMCVMGDEPVNYLYLVDAYYSGVPAKAIAWNDPDLAINWPVDKPIVSKRDQENIGLRELFPEKFKSRRFGNRHFTRPARSK